MKKIIYLESITVSQSKVIKKKLNMKHLLIIDYLNQFFTSGNARCKIYNGQTYYLITLNKILEDLPILGIKKRRLQEIIKDLETANIIIKLSTNSSLRFIKLNLYPILF